MHTAGDLCVARFKYIHMEEMLGNIPGARQIFERWMAFEPDHHGWMAYIKVHACTPMRPSALGAQQGAACACREPR